MAADAPLHPETLALHAGWRADPATGAVAVPIFQTSSYQFRDTDHAANLFARSLAIHPASTTHSQLAPEDRLATGVSDGYVRLSIGLEHPDDILADLDRGLAAAGTLARAA